MSDKKFELISLRGGRGCYTASIYNRLGGYFKELYFMDYSKKDIIYILRHNHNCIVRRGNY